jgi:hypothetical protein
MHAQIVWVNGHSLVDGQQFLECECKEDRSTCLAILGATIYQSSRVESINQMKILHLNGAHTCQTNALRFDLMLP